MSLQSYKILNFDKEFIDAEVKSSNMLSIGKLKNIDYSVMFSDIPNEIDFDILNEAFKDLKYDKKYLKIISTKTNEKKQLIRKFTLNDQDITPILLKEYILKELYKSGIGKETDVFKNFKQNHKYVNYTYKSNNDNSEDQVNYFNKYLKPEKNTDYLEFRSKINILINKIGSQNIFFSYDSTNIYLQLLYETILEELKEEKNNQLKGAMFEIVTGKQIETQRIRKLPNLFYSISKSTFQLKWFKELDGIYVFEEDSEIDLHYYCFAKDINKECEKIKISFQEDEKNNKTTTSSCKILKGTILYLEVKTSLYNIDENYSQIENQKDSNFSKSNSYVILERLQKFINKICFFDPYNNSNSLYLLSYNSSLSTNIIINNLKSYENEKKLHNRLDRIIFNFQKINIKSIIGSYIDKLSNASATKNSELEREYLVLKEELKLKDKENENLFKLLEQKDKAIEQKDKAIEQMDKSIEQMDKAIEQKDKAIQNFIKRKRNKNK
jgi:hypothetical protein